MANLNYPDSIPYAAVADVQNLLGAISYNASATQDTGFLTTVIQDATQDFETQTNRRFCPVRHVERIDGSGVPSIILEHSPVIAINYIKNYINAQLLTVIQQDYELTLEPSTGIVRIPLSYTTSASVQFTQAFFRGNRNVLADYWAGYSRIVYGETLTTTDNLTYSFANATLAQTLQQQFGPIDATPPIYRPKVYVNGTPLVNTTYQFENLASGSVWNVVQDNIYYTVNWTAGTITFNSSQSGNVITSDYSYYYIPYDVTKAVAKLAAIQVLEIEGLAQNGTLGQGASDLEMDGYKVTYGKQSAYPWEGSIAVWQSEIQTTVNKYRRKSPPMTGGFYSSDWGHYS